MSGRSRQKAGRDVSRSPWTEAVPLAAGVAPAGSVSAAGDSAVGAVPCWTASAGALGGMARPASPVDTAPEPGGGAVVCPVGLVSAVPSRNFGRGVGSVPAWLTGASARLVGPPVGDAGAGAVLRAASRRGRRGRRGVARAPDVRPGIVAGGGAVAGKGRAAMRSRVASVAPA